MIIIGEKINATRKSIAAALEARDEAQIIQTATEQIAAGANYLDINGGDPRQGREVENMAWLVEKVQAHTEAPLAIDSANPDALRKGLSLADRKPILNSISLESERLESMLPIVSEFDCLVVALLMDDSGTPTSTEDRLSRASILVDKLLSAGKKVDELIVDPCFMPVSADPSSGRAVIDAIAAIRKEWPEIHIGGGLSNVSFGLPKRRLVNAACLTQAIYAGMDYAIADPCTPGIISTILAAEAVAGRDDFCMGYVIAEREGRLGT